MADRISRRVASTCCRAARLPSWYTKENAPALAAALRDGLGQWKARPRPATRYGQPYEVKMILTGANGRQATAKTGWLVEEAGTVPRLISVYLYKQK